MQNNGGKYLILYFPFILALLLSDLPKVSYVLAWLGSFYLFFICYAGKIKPLPKDRPILEQLFRPIFILHVIFAGYMACTSIFYFLNALGYEYSTYLGNSYATDSLFNEIAKCQRLYVLGHAAFLHGLLSAMRYPVEKKYVANTKSMSILLFIISLVTLPLSRFLVNIDAVIQLGVQMGNLSILTGTVAFAFAINEKRRNMIIATGILFAITFANTLVSGFKEPVILSVVLFGLILLPVYGKKLIPVFGAAIICLFLFLPTFIGKYRGAASSGTNAIEARDQALKSIIDNDNLQDELRNNNWAFLTDRISEIGMFVSYTSTTPSKVPFYNLNIIKQAIFSIIPRAFWSGKPDTESMVMNRPYNAGIITRGAAVSAKPAYIVDCYLSAGHIGVLVGLFIYGYIAQFIALKSEELFGGYFMGTVVIFTGLFQIFLRGNCFEFMFNTVFWCFVSVFLIFNFFKARNIIIPFR